MMDAAFTNVVRCTDVEHAAIAIADWLVDVARQAIKERGVFSIALGGGNTPRGLYQLLASESYRHRVAWEKVRFFWGDERAVPPSHRDSNFRMANQSLLQPLGIAPEQIHRMAAERKDLDDAAHEYQLEIATAFKVPVNGRPPSLDVVLLGMGEDGHVASLFPETPVLDEENRWVVSNQVARLGIRRMTMTTILINAAREIIFLVAGAAKADCLARVLEGPEDPQGLPAQLIHPTAGKVTWFVDEPAAAQLTKY